VPVASANKSTIAVKNTSSTTGPLTKHRGEFSSFSAAIDAQLSIEGEKRANYIELQLETVHSASQC